MTQCGLAGEPNGGTCTSMPVLYASVARRLRYPVKLVHAKAHLFCRWEGAKLKFNIECTSQGLIFHPDAYYRMWPKPLSDAEVQREEFLVSLSPAQEVAAFMAARAWCLEDHGRTAEAVKAYEAACRLHPTFPAYQAFRNVLLRRECRTFVRPPLIGIQAATNPYGRSHIPLPINRRLP